MKELAVFRRRRRRCTQPLPMSNWLRFYCQFFFRKKKNENTAAYESRKKARSIRCKDKVDCTVESERWSLMEVAAFCGKEQRLWRCFFRFASHSFSFSIVWRQQSLVQSVALLYPATATPHLHTSGQPFA